MSLFAVPSEPVARSRHLVSAVTATLTTLAFIGIAFTSAGWLPALSLSLVTLAMLAGHTIRHRDPLFARLALVAAIGAPFALIGDWWCIKEAGLVYQQGGPFVVKSPLYLPLLFPTAVFQVWYVMDMVRFRMEGEDATGPMRVRTWVTGVVVSVLFGGIYVPFYEFLAKWGDLWVYEGQPGLFEGVVPWYVIVAEIFQFSLFPLIIKDIRTKSLPDTALTGLLIGIATVGCWVVAVFFFA